jgi:fatty-acyl-CoA synthase
VASPYLSIASGPPLRDEPGLGPLTLPGFLREVTAAYGEREAVILRTQGTRWTYADLWERSVEVARALRAAGVGSGGRVGVLMTNRPEWIAAVFGTSLAGGVAVTLSTFSTPAELDYLLQVFFGDDEITLTGSAKIKSSDLRSLVIRRGLFPAG